MLANQFWAVPVVCYFQPIESGKKKTSQSYHFPLIIGWRKFCPLACCSVGGWTKEIPHSKQGQRKVRSFSSLYWDPEVLSGLGRNPNDLTNRKQFFFFFIFIRLTFLLNEAWGTTVSSVLDQGHTSTSPGNTPSFFSFFLASLSRFLWVLASGFSLRKRVCRWTLL